MIGRRPASFTQIRHFPMFVKVVNDDNTDVQVLEYDENCAETLNFVETRGSHMCLRGHEHVISAPRGGRPQTKKVSFMLWYT